MGIFKNLYEAKKHEIEIKQGKHGLMQKYLVLVPLLCLYWYKALFMPGREFYLVLLIPITIIFIFAIRKDLKKKETERENQNDANIDVQGLRVDSNTGRVLKSDVKRSLLVALGGNSYLAHTAYILAEPAKTEEDTIVWKERWVVIDNKKNKHQIDITFFEKKGAGTNFTIELDKENKTKKEANKSDAIKIKTADVKKSFGEYATFSGKATRKEFWLLVMGSSVLFVISSFVWVGAGMTAGVPDPLINSVEFILVSFFLFSASLVMSRRLHDINYSGWWVLLFFVPFIGWLGLLMAAFFPSAKTKKVQKPQTIGGKILKVVLIIAGLFCAVVFISAMIAGIKEEESENEKTGIQVGVDMENGEVNVKKVNVNPDNTVQGPDESVALYCGLKTREIEFNNSMYYLSFSKQITDNYYTMEFVAKGNISEHYQEMILVHCNTSDVKPMQVLFSVMKGVQEKTSNGEARQYPVSQNGQKVGFDFVVGEVNFFKEWNMFSYAPLPRAKTGVLMFGLTKRFYANDSDLNNFENKQEELKKQYEDKLMNFPLNTLF